MKSQIRPQARFKFFPWVPIGLVVALWLGIVATWLYIDFRFREYKRLEALATPVLDQLNQDAFEDVPMYESVHVVETRSEGNSWTTGVHESSPVIYGRALVIRYDFADDARESKAILSMLYDDLIGREWAEVSGPTRVYAGYTLSKAYSCLSVYPDTSSDPGTEFTMRIYQDYRRSPVAPPLPEPLELFSMSYLLTSRVLSCGDGTN